MKRLISLALASIMMLSTFAACGSKEEAKTETTKTETTKTETTEKGDAFPSETITIVSPWGVGGGADIVSRKLGEIIQKNTGVSVIVKNSTGGTGTIGMTEVFEADPDGYTLVWAGATAYAVVPQFIDVGYKAEDFSPIVGARISWQDIIANPEAGIASLDDLKKVGQERPITIATGGTGNDANIVAQATMHELGLDYEIIVYESQGEMVNAVAGKQVDIALVAPPTWFDFAEVGKVAGIATYNPEGSLGTPNGDILSLADQGVDVSYVGIDYWACRSDVPQEIQDELTKILTEATQSQEYLDYMDEIGFPILDATPEEINAEVLHQVEVFEEYIPLATK